MADCIRALFLVGVLAAVVVLIAVTGTSPASAAAAQEPLPKASLELRSGKGDYVGAGRNYRYTSRKDDLWIEGTRDGVEAHVPAKWNVYISRSARKHLSVGKFKARRDYFKRHPRAGLFASGLGRSCSFVRGKFRIFGIKFQGDGQLKAIDFRFVQHCDGRRPALTGRVRLSPRDLRH